MLAALVVLGALISHRLYLCLLPQGGGMFASKYVVVLVVLMLLWLT